MVRARVQQGLNKLNSVPARGTLLEQLPTELPKIIELVRSAHKPGTLPAEAAGGAATPGGGGGGGVVMVEHAEPEAEALEDTTGAAVAALEAERRQLAAQRAAMVAQQEEVAAMLARQADQEAVIAARLAVQEEAGPSCAEPDPAVLMPPPPPRQPKPAAAPAPSNDPDLEARQFAGLVLRMAMMQHRAREREFARSEKRVAAADKIHDAMQAKIDRLQRKKTSDAAKELMLLLKAEQYINKELMLHAQAMYAASSAENTMLKCQIKVKDLHIQHLLRRLRNGQK